MEKSLRKQVEEIKDKKMEFVKIQKFEKACEMREKEVEFIKEHFGVNVVGKNYSIDHNDEIIITNR